MSASLETGAALVGIAPAANALVTDVATRAKPFDLRRQESIERSSLRRLQPMFETIGHRIAGALSSALRQAVRVELVELDQANWEDFAGSLPDPSFLSSAVLLPHEGRCVLHVPVPLALLLIDHYLGGDGASQPERAQLTEIERNLVSGLVDDLWNEVPHPFASFATLNPAMTSTATSALLIQVGRPGTLCVLVRMQVVVGEAGELPLELCIPANVVRSLIEQLERHQSHGALGSGADRHESRRRLLSVPVELKVGYPPIGLTPGELLGLRVGDVVHLGTFDPHTPLALPLTLGDVPFGTGVLVEKGNRLACSVLTKKERHDDE